MKKILIVDDDKGSLNDLKRALNFKEEYEIETTTDPNKAYELIKNNDFDLVISDTQMPGMSGLELKTKLDNENIKTKFIGISARSDIFEKEWNKLGCDCLPKPYEIEELYNTVETNLK